MSKKNPPQEQSIEAIKLHNVKVNYRLYMVIVGLTMGVVGVIGGYFLSIGIITSSQAQAVDVVKSIAEVKR